MIVSTFLLTTPLIRFHYKLFTFCQEAIDYKTHHYQQYLFSTTVAKYFKRIDGLDPNFFEMCSMRGLETEEIISYYVSLMNVLSFIKKFPCPLIGNISDYDDFNAYIRESILIKRDSFSTFFN